MNNKNGKFHDSEFVFRQLVSKDAVSLISAGFPFCTRILTPSLKDQLFQTFNLVPREIGLVAYNAQKKRAVGYLCLVAHTDSLYSIKYVFSDPNFRRKGVASGLLNYALILAKNKGAKKIFLTTYPDSAATKLYRKLGFRRIVETFMVKGEGYTSNFLLESPDPPVKLQASRNEDLLYSIYQRSLGQEWISFFGTNSSNLTNGYSQEFRRFYLKTFFVNASADLCAMVFNLPLFSTANSELYGLSDAFFPSTLKKLMKTLYKRGIKYARITLFNIKGNECLDLLKEKRFFPYKAVYMGRSL